MPQVNRIQPRRAADPPRVGRAGLDSAWLKWGRAVVHAQALETELRRVDPQRQPFGVVRFEYQPKRHGFALVIDRVTPIPAQWRLIVGDCANGFRSSLDHIAWALVKRGNEPEATESKKAKNIYFPITKTRADFPNAAKGMLPGVRRADLTLVRGAQPWQRGVTRVQWHCLSLLDGIVKADKHREIQGLWMIPEFAGYWDLRAKDCVPGDRVRARRTLMEVDTEVGFMKARKTGPNPNIQMQYQVTFYPAFHPELRLQEWMDQTTITVLLVLRELGEPPEELMNLGLDLDGLSAAADAWITSAELWSSVRGRGVARAPNLPV